MKLFIDRLEDEIAVCETETQTFVKLPVSLLPKGSREGSVLHFLAGDYVLLPDEEAERRHEAFELQTSLFPQDEA